MANLVLTSTTNTVTVNFGVYGGTPANPFSEGLYSKSYLVRFNLSADGTFIQMYFSDGSISNVTWNQSNNPADPEDGLNLSTIDSIDGVAPTSQADLLSKLAALLG
jgi:hypothetical protein